MQKINKIKNAIKPKPRCKGGEHYSIFFQSSKKQGI
jgi:hypothetical protein